MAPRPNYVIDAELLNVVMQISNAEDAMEAWWDLTEWTSEFYRQTGEPATIDDLYQEMSAVLRDEEYEVERM